MRGNEGTHERIRIFVVDDHPAMRQGLRAVLTRPDLEVVGEAGTGEEAVQGILKHEPRVVVLDVRLPDMDGLQVLRKLKPRLPATSFILFTAFEESAYLTGAVAEGAAGFAVKTDETHDLLDIVRRTAAGEDCLPRSYWVPLLRRMEERRGAATNPGHDWPERDVQILHFMAHGQCNARIAELLEVNPGTLQFFIKSIFARLEVSDRTHAVAQAIEKGILSVPDLKE